MLIANQYLASFKVIQTWLLPWQILISAAVSWPIKTGAWNTIIYRNTMWSNINDILEVILQENRYACMQNKCLGKICRLLLLLYLSTTVLSPVFSTPRSESQRFQSETCEVEKSLGLGRSVGWSVSFGRNLRTHGIHGIDRLPLNLWRSYQKIHGIVKRAVMQELQGCAN